MVAAAGVKLNQPLQLSDDAYYSKAASSSELQLCDVQFGPVRYLVWAILYVFERRKGFIF